MEVFTLTPFGKLRASSGQALTLSLKGEGIAELRKSYFDFADISGHFGSWAES